MNSSVSMAMHAMSCDVHMICDDLMKEIALEHCIWQLSMYLRTNKPYRTVLIEWFEQKCQTVLCAIMPSAIFDKYYEDITRHGP